jgi:hypothetical protein
VQHLRSATHPAARGAAGGQEPAAASIRGRQNHQPAHLGCEFSRA